MTRYVQEICIVQIICDHDKFVYALADIIFITFSTRNRLHRLFNDNYLQEILNWCKTINYRIIYFKINGKSKNM